MGPHILGHLENVLTSKRILKSYPKGVRLLGRNETEMKKKAKIKIRNPEQTRMYTKGKHRNTCTGLRSNQSRFGEEGKLERSDTVPENLKRRKESTGTEYAKKRPIQTTQTKSCRREKKILVMKQTILAQS